MDSILKLNLQSDSEKAEATNLPRAEHEESQPQTQPHSKRFNKFVSRTAHKAASHTSRSGSGMFTK
jgi:hypothetical protein